jgi:hypothetical protein
MMRTLKGRSFAMTICGKRRRQIVRGALLLLAKLCLVVAALF